MNWTEIRSLFPGAEKTTYFDLANKCILPTFTTDTIRAYIDRQQEDGGDKEAWFGTLKEARKKTARLLGAQPEEIAFTKNTSEGLNLAANGIPFKAGDTVLLNLNEHPNNVYCWLNLKRKGVNIKWIPTRDGEITVEDIAALTDASTRCVAIASTNYAPGNRYDLKAIGAFCRERGIYLVVDAVQSFGVVQLDVRACNIDILCASGHKYLFCPHGVGVFYCRREILNDIIPTVAARTGVDMAAQIENPTLEYKLTFANDCRRFEVGNYNYLGLTAFNRSLDFLLELGMDRVEERILYLSERLIDALNGTSVTVTTPREREKRAAIVCFSHPRIKELYEYLLKRGVVLTLRRSEIRLSVGVYNNEKDIARIVELIGRFDQGA